MRQAAHFGLLVCVLFAVGGVVDAFSGHVSLRAGTPRRAAAGAVCSLSREHERAEESTDPTLLTQLSRRSVLAVSLASVIGGQCTVAAADDAGDVETGSPAEVVVKGEMRLEVGADQKLKKAGGKARAEVVLRCVGKGIISKTTEEINLDDFPVRFLMCAALHAELLVFDSPSRQNRCRCACLWHGCRSSQLGVILSLQPAGRPGAEGESGGVQFIVTVGGECAEEVTKPTVGNAGQRQQIDSIQAIVGAQNRFKPM